MLGLVSLVNTAVLSGGLIYGWGPIHQMLMDEGQFVELCLGSDCSAQKTALQAIFSSAFIALSIMSVVFGISLDHLGPRFTVVCGLLLSTVGNVLFAYSDSQHFNMFLAGYCLIAGGGIAPFLCHFNFANAFSNPALYISVVNGLFNVAGFVYMTIPLFEVSRKSFFLLYAMLNLLGIVSVCLTYPRRSLRPGAIVKLPLMRLFRGSSEVHAELLSNAEEAVEEDNAPVESAKLMDYAFSKPLLWIVLWYSLVLMGLSFMTGAIPDILNAYPESELYVNTILPIVSNVAFVFAPLSGFTISHFGFTSAFMTVNLSTTGFLLFALLPGSIHWQLLTLIASAVLKGVFFNTFYTFLALKFPAEINGSLVAISTGSAAAFGTANYGWAYLVQHVFHGSYLVTNLIITVLLVPTYFVVTGTSTVRETVCSQRNSEGECVSV